MAAVADAGDDRHRRAGDRTHDQGAVEGAELGILAPTADDQHRLVANAGGPDLGGDAHRGGLALQRGGEMRGGDLKAALLEDGDGVGVADRAGAAGHDADPAGGQRQPHRGALAFQ
jgi:hypothetical protein